MLLKSRASLTCLRACFLPGRAKVLSASRYDITRSPPAEAYDVVCMRLYSVYGIEMENYLTAFHYQGHVSYMRLMMECY